MLQDVAGWMDSGMMWSKFERWRRSAGCWVQQEHEPFVHTVTLCRAELTVCTPNAECPNRLPLAPPSSAPLLLRLLDPSRPSSQILIQRTWLAQWQTLPTSPNPPSPKRGSQPQPNLSALLPCFVAPRPFSPRSPTSLLVLLHSREQHSLTLPAHSLCRSIEALHARYGSVQIR
ncbi:uncharacterized protein EKO05_0008919 [Ascochyta rabiei]|uniref:uncharacterized protein n=1 Tax=Didymella rabiei TaxID=5454 RepID=UPI00220611D2|nr:uncharacterized protein EKO05_0008919 [Ascochyta rabiei]UPX18626.1 hypothetical protein EKO05_0008919 [Ascochyta rabiei]